jgi:sugar lactone lactonase YvrE
LIIHPGNLSNGASNPIIQTLANFGPTASCRGLAMDCHGNIYFALGNSGVFSIIMLQAGTHQAVQLPMAVERAQGLAVSPDGQHLYVWDAPDRQSGRVLLFKQPWSDKEGELLAKFDDDAVEQLVCDHKW